MNIQIREGAVMESTRGHLLLPYLFIRTQQTDSVCTYVYCSLVSALYMFICTQQTNSVCTHVYSSLIPVVRQYVRILCWQPRIFGFNMSRSARYGIAPRTRTRNFNQVIISLLNANKWIGINHDHSRRECS